VAGAGSQQQGGDAGGGGVVVQVQGGGHLDVNGGQADRAAVQPPAGVGVDGVEHPHAPLGVAADADVGLVHFLIKAAVRVGVLVQKPGQGCIRRLAGAGA